MSHVRSAVAVTAATALLTLAAVAGADHRTVHAGAWSYFGDPRSVTHGGRVYTGWIGTDKTIGVEQYDPATGVSLHRHLYRQDELDDHDNPSLAVWRDHGMFFEPSENPYSTVVQLTDEPHLSGYISDANLDRLRGSPSAIVDQLGGGSVVLLIDNPNFRGYWLGTNRLFLNALLFGGLMDVPEMP